MPVEIRELHIRVAVNAESKAQAPAKPGDVGGADQDAIVAECVEQVLRIIQAKKER
jgi:hypothetical protein